MPDRPYYFFFRNESGQRGHLAILSIPGAFSTAAWGELQRGLEEIAEKDPEKRRWGYLYSLSLYPDQRRGAVHWDMELAGASGARYLLMPLPGATAKEIKACQAHIRSSFDVVSLSVLRATDSMQQPAEELLGRILAKGQWSDRPAEPAPLMSDRDALPSAPKGARGPAL
jgi:hypothetical protein